MSISELIEAAKARGPWRLSGVTGQLRNRSGECPICAVANAAATDFGPRYRNGDFSLAAAAIGLAVHDTTRVVRVADGRGLGLGDIRLRRRLVKALVGGKKGGAQ